MNKLFITGASGFVGQNLVQYFKNYNIQKINLRDCNIENIQLLNSDVIIHLAGIAHDTKKVKNSLDYYKVNFELTKHLYDAFLASDSKIFIFFSSVKAVADTVIGELTEDSIPQPITDYGKSKLLAENYILSIKIPKNKRVYILRPCMIHGYGNKGNLNLLYKLVLKGLPWPFGSFTNLKSFCSIENLSFIVKQLINQNNIPSGVYNISDDEPISSNEIILLICKSKNKKPIIWTVPMKFIEFVAKFGDLFNLTFNTERLRKLTDSYIVSNAKIKNAIRCELPVTCKQGLIKTFESFNQYDSDI